MRGEAPASIQPAKERGAAAQPGARPGGRGQGLLRGRGGSPGLPGVRADAWQAPRGGPGPIERAHCIHEPREGDEASAGWLGGQIWACRCHSTDQTNSSASWPMHSLAADTQVGRMSMYSWTTWEFHGLKDKDDTC